MTERRLSRRYDLSLPVMVHLPAVTHARNGKTRDISTRGVYFTINEHLTPGSELDFTLTLPSEITRDTEVFVRAHGRIVRVESRANDERESIGVAAVIEKYEIIRDNPVRH